MTHPHRLEQELVLTSIALMSEAHYALLEANRALRGLDLVSGERAERVTMIDAAVLELTIGKWLWGRATGELADFSRRTVSGDDLKAAQERFRRASTLARSSLAPKDSEVRFAHQLVERLRRDRTEISWIDGVPVVPSIAPIVLLRGSSYEMGIQYASQCLEIFGAFVFETVGRKALVDETAEVLRAWERQLRLHAPEVLDMAHGMSVGASRAGVSLGYRQALSMWTDVRPPAQELEPIGVLDAEGGGVLGAYFGAYGAPQQVGGPCSGAAAWGSSTVDGHACFAASTDHDCTFQVTLVAFPDDGDAFVYTPFSVNGSIPGVGRFGFAGHPGFNRAGVAYVHHGGGGSCLEPPETWGYGLPRGAATMHLLRYATSARGALDAELAMPTGDVGKLLGTAGGFYVDDEFGYVLEDRSPGRPVYRSGTTDDGGKLRSVLYATNNVMDPGLVGAACPPADGYRYEPGVGWFTRAPDDPAVRGGGPVTRQLWARGSERRNRMLFGRLMSSSGPFSFDDLFELFRRGPDFGDDPWPRIEARLLAGELPIGSVAHRGNAFVAGGHPASFRYRGAVGCIAGRSTPPTNPGHGYFYFDEVDTFWEIKLLGSVEAVTEDARRTARRLVERARRVVGATRVARDDTRHPLLIAAEDEIASGEHQQLSGDDVSDPNRLARGLRSFTRAQVRARQLLATTGAST